MNKKRIALWLAVVCSAMTFAQVQTLPPSYLKNDVTPLEVYRAEPERINNLVHTKLDLKFDYAKQEVLGDAWITLKPHFYPTAVLELDAKAMLIHQVDLIVGTKTKKLKFTYDGLKINIDLDRTYKRDESYTIHLKYTARPNEVKQEGSQAINDAKGIYFINPEGIQTGVPTQIWTQGESESSSCWFPTIDKTNQKTSQEIYLTYPQKYLSLSNGLLVSSINNNDGTKTDYWKMTQKHAPYLFFVGIGDYAVVKDKWRSIDVDYYVEPAYKDYARDIFGNTPEMMEFFSNLLDYPYPWDKYAQMTAREYVSGAMENTTASLFNDGVQQKPGQLIDENTAETVIAHELFHHWFGDLVTAESWSNLSMNEAFANYSEYLWVEHKYGKEKADQNLDAEIESYKNGDHFDKHLVRMHYRSQEDMFDQVTYNKGGAILHMLRNYLGDEAFFKGLSKYLKDNEFGKAEYTQLRLALEDVSGRDLNWFFNQWFLGSGQPNMVVKSEFDAKNKKVIIELEQQGENYFEFPYAIDIVVNGKVTRQHIWVAAKQRDLIEFSVSKKPEVIIYNADQVLLSDLTEASKSIAEYRLQYQYAPANFVARKQAVLAFAEQQTTDGEALKGLVAALSDHNDGIRALAINNLNLTSPAIVEAVVPLLKNIVRNDLKTLVQAQAIIALNQAGEFDEDLFDTAAKSKSFRVQSAAIDGILKNDPIRFVDYQSGIDEEVIKNSEELITAFIPVWVAENNLSKADLVIQTTAFYLFAKSQDAAVGDQLEKGFIWVMSNDTDEATQTAVQLYSLYYAYLKKQSEQAATLIKRMTQTAADLKKIAYEKDKVKNTNLKKQWELLQQTVDKMD
ncbi:M1 family metallopeptidase [Flavobacterium sp. NKUCC04_CG]|uniref:M1 family metallopeptidase n=1 Tax=Flavobacterium sp. NKUCC04_CG TaxID=2842121 RepID=UPI001C5BC294|nr:M1 family aminopeptidase [Flavobacterium sp. NKUCC04_CG]MBW3519708.1 M1 family metallopeptidase [Flavobacterium sp. NKUCC04_CG]